VVVDAMKNKYIAGLLLFAVVISGCIGGSDPNVTTTTQKAVVTTLAPILPPPTTLSPTAADLEFEKYLSDYKQKRLFRDNYSVPDRSAYEISQQVFALLPPVPNDFLYKVYLLKYGKFVDIASLGPEYYKQPEFDPLFTKFGLMYWNEWKDANYKKTHWGTVGVRSYPYSQHLVAKPGYSFNITLIFSSDWNIETYQGVRIIPGFLQQAISEDGKLINATPDAAKHINVNVTPSEFLLSPAFPQFTPDWANKLTFTGKIADDTPPGLYILTMTVTKPSSVQSDKWLLQYLNLYSEGADMITTDKPYLQAFINVET
jgi:hypothetical protein